MIHAIKDLFVKSDGVNLHLDRRRSKLRVRVGLLVLGLTMLTVVGIQVPSLGLALIVIGGLALVFVAVTLLVVGE